MLTFKSIDDLSKLNSDDSSYSLIEDLVYRLCVDIPKENFKYDPSADGWINLVQPNDIGRVITEIWDDWTLLDVEWEAVTRHKSNQSSFLVACFLCDNQKGFLFIFDENADWLQGELRQILEEHLDP